MSTRDASHPDTVRQCGRRRCRHRYRAADAVWVPDADDPDTARATCPECGHDFYTLVKTGAAETTREGGADA